MIRYIILIFSFLFVSCSQHVKISPRRCAAPEARWSMPKDKIDFEFKKELSSNGEVTYIKDLLASKKQNCENLETFSMTHQYSFTDVFINFIPFLGSSTLTLRGSKQETTTSKTDQ